MKNKTPFLILGMLFVATFSFGQLMEPDKGGDGPGGAIVYPEPNRLDPSDVLEPDLDSPAEPEAEPADPQQTNQEPKEPVERDIIDKGPGPK